MPAIGTRTDYGVRAGESTQAAPRARFAVKIVSAVDWGREKLQDNAAVFSRSSSPNGAHIENSSTHIIPLIIGDQQRVIKLNDVLWAHDTAVVGIRPPTVSANYRSCCLIDRDARIYRPTGGFGSNVDL